MRVGQLEALTHIRISMNSELIGEDRYSQQQKYSVFEDLRDGSKQKLVPSMVNDLAI